MIGFYVTCAIFVFGILGLLLKAFTGINIFRCSATWVGSSC